MFTLRNPEIADAIMIQIDGGAVSGDFPVRRSVDNFGLGRRREGGDAYAGCGKAI